MARPHGTKSIVKDLKKVWDLIPNKIEPPKELVIPQWFKDALKTNKS